MNFIVVQAQLDYDYIEDVIYVAKFATQEEADLFIQDKKAKQDSLWIARINYIDQWVDAIELPETDYNGWKEFLATWSVFCHPNRYIMPQDFKKQFKNYLKEYSSFKFEGYNPPDVNFDAQNLFVIEIK